MHYCPNLWGLSSADYSLEYAHWVTRSIEELDAAINSPSWTPVRICKDLYKPLRICTDLYKPLRTCTDLYKPLRTCTDLYRHLHRLVRTCIDTVRKLYRSVQVYTSLHRCLYKSVRVCTSLCKSVYKYILHTFHSKRLSGRSWVDVNRVIPDSSALPMKRAPWRPSFSCCR